MYRNLTSITAKHFTSSCCEICNLGQDLTTFNFTSRIPQFNFIWSYCKIHKLHQKLRKLQLTTKIPEDKFTCFHCKIQGEKSSQFVKLFHVNAHAHFQILLSDIHAAVSLTERAMPYMEITVTAYNELCYTARCKQLPKMISKSDINKRFQSQKILLKFTKAS